MAKEPLPLLLHIQDAINLITAYIEDYTFDQFKADRKTLDAVIRELEIIGEAAGKLENDFKESYPSIPWRVITDFRNVLAHEYWDIDIEIVWKAATIEIKELKATLLPIIESLETKSKS